MAGKLGPKSCRNSLKTIGIPLALTGSLTTGADTLTGTSAIDVFNAVEVAGSSGPANTLSVGDSINGGAGNDTLNITQTGAFAQPLNTTISNVETVNLISGTSGSTINTTGWTGVTALNVTTPGAVTATAAATTAIAVTDAVLAAQAITVNGGSTVTVTATESPRISRRLHTLRRWSHEQEIKSFFPRSP